MRLFQGPTPFKPNQVANYKGTAPDAFPLPTMDDSPHQCGHIMRGVCIIASTLGPLVGEVRADNSPEF